MFRRSDRFFVHRIVERRNAGSGNFLITKGDANPVPDAAIAASDVLARVERIYRGNRGINFHSRAKRALGMLIAYVSRKSRFWFALVLTHRIAIRPARRLLRTLRLSRAAAR